MTKSEIREYLMERQGVMKVRISRDGSINVYGNMPRGDGGAEYWWQFLGYVTDREYKNDHSTAAIRY
jgi:hypothetical protein